VHAFERSALAHERASAFLEDDQHTVSINKRSFIRCEATDDIVLELEFDVE
jgi:hypothetical protein